MRMGKLIRRGVFSSSHQTADMLPKSTATRRVGRAVSTKGPQALSDSVWASIHRCFDFDLGFVAPGALGEPSQRRDIMSQEPGVAVAW